MAKTDFNSVDAYIAAQPEEVRGVLERVRSAIRTALPTAKEVISYQIPAYRLPGGLAIYFAGWRRHYSLYPATALVVATLKDQLAPYEKSKGTIRFALSEPVPVSLIARIAKLRAKEIAERAKATAATPKKHKLRAARARQSRRATTRSSPPK
jgi:uncharacterized protein YdhG (YjbR/CyaY superfamily)